MTQLQAWAMAHNACIKSPISSSRAPSDATNSSAKKTGVSVATLTAIFLIPIFIFRAIVSAL